MSDGFWCELREHFVILQELVASVDDLFAYPILLSCGTDVYFTCFLLYNSFGSFPERLNALYFYYSITFIISRTFLTLFFATTVYEAARRPRILLKSIPPQAWGPEVDRFAYQMSCEKVALSAKQFFYFTRHVMLTVSPYRKSAMKMLGIKLYLIAAPRHDNDLRTVRPGSHSRATGSRAADVRSGLQ